VHSGIAALTRRGRRLIRRIPCAEDALARNFGRFGLASSDMAMLGRMNGIDMATLLAKRHPGLPVLPCSGGMLTGD
jgi:DNA-binding LytR/AlgR family response regulator